MQYLKDEGLIAPDEVISPEIDSVPFNFTTLNSRQVGALHSRYAVRHAHAIFVAAKTSADLAIRKRELRLAQAKYRYLNKKKFKTKYELDDAMVTEDGIEELMSEITLLEAREEVIKALALGYEDFKSAASREMFRRSSEEESKYAP